MRQERRFDLLQKLISWIIGFLNTPYKITVERDYREKYTSGVLTTSGGLRLFTVEKPWLDNKPYVSCIPEGEYKAYIREKSSNGRVIELLDVPDRTFIQFHVGNTEADVVGCFAVGSTPVGDNGWTYKSADAMKMLLAEAEKQDSITVIIKKAP